MGYFLTFLVGLYFPRRSTLLTPICEPFLQIGHSLAIQKIYDKVNKYARVRSINNILYSDFNHVRGDSRSIARDGGFYSGRPYCEIRRPPDLKSDQASGFVWLDNSAGSFYNIKNQRWGPAIVGSAEPAANILIGILFAIIFRLSGEYATFSNLVLAIVQINIWLALFNLVPIPPLDGSKLLFSLLSPRFYNLERAMEQYGFFILIILIFILPGILFIPLGALASIILQLLLGS